MSHPSHSGARRRSRSATILAVAWALAVLVVAAGTAWAGQDEGDVLWKAYAQGSPDRRALLEQCAERLDRVRGKRLLAGEALDWNTDPDVRWLLEHRTPAVLVVEREMGKSPAGSYLGTLAQLGMRLGHRRLRRRLPDLLGAARTNGERLAVMEVLSELRTPEAVLAMKEYLRGKRTIADEAVVCEAARGLGLTREKDFLPLIRMASGYVTSPQGGVRLAVARYRCGDASAAAGLLQVVREAVLEPAVQAEVLDALAEQPPTQAVPDLAEAAVRAVDPRVADAAFQALLCATGHGAPPPGVRLQAGQEQEDAAEADPEDQIDLGGLWHEKTQQERREIVDQLVLRWDGHGGLRAEPTGLFGTYGAPQDGMKPR